MKAGIVASKASEMLDCCDSEGSPYFISNAIIGAILKSDSVKKVFIAQALASRDDAKLSGEYFASADVHDELKGMLVRAEYENESRSTQRDINH